MTVVGLFVVAALWIFLAPPQAGGSTTYTLIAGNSMEPLLERGDFAGIQPHAPYQVGDVALYRSARLGRTVLHRIVAVDDDVLTFKGDNNDFLDPERVPTSAVVGRLWFAVPHLGSVMSWLREPVHTAAIVGVLAGLVVATTLGIRGRSRRRRAEHADAPPAVLLLGREWPGAATALVGVLVLGAVAFATPSNASVVTPGAYRHEGEFSYSAKTVAPNPAYPSGEAVTGQPVFFDLFDSIELRFDYRFVSVHEHAVRGRISLGVLASDATGWHNLYDLQTNVAFEGDEGSVTGAFQREALRTLVRQIAENSGAPNAELSMFLRPSIEVAGTLEGRPIRSTFEPALPILVTHTLLRVTAPPPVPPGTSGLPVADVYTPRSVESALLGRPATISLVRYQVKVTTARVASVLLLAAWALVVAALVVARRRRPMPDELAIAASHHLLMIPVESLEGVSALPVAEVTDFDSLSRLAEDRDIPMLVETAGTRPRFAVVDDGTMFAYLNDVGPLALGAGGHLDGAPPAHIDIAEHRPRQPRLSIARALHAGAALVPVVLVGTVVLSFTATGVVPSSFIGVSRHPVIAAQLAPAQCADVAVTSILVATGSSLTGTEAKELLIGLSGGNRKLDGSGGDDCIVAGGGAGSKNTITGGSGNDVCISPSSANTTFKGCEQEIIVPG